MKHINLKYREALSVKERELSRAARDKQSLHIERAADETDNRVLRFARELAIDAIQSDSNLLRRVRAAMKRLDEGGYGVCLSCEEEISSRRLQALPWAEYCLACQEALDGPPTPAARAHLSAAA